MAILLFAFWLILNGRLAFDVIVTGVIITAALVFCMCKIGKWSFRKEKLVYVLFPGAVHFCVSLLIEIAKANMAVLKTIGRRNTEPYIRTIHTGLKTRLARVMLANSITLTPGTVTVQLLNDMILVHCLTKDMADGLTGMKLERLLMEMEAKALGKRV